MTNQLTVPNLSTLEKNDYHDLCDKPEFAEGYHDYINQTIDQTKHGLAYEAGRECAARRLEQIMHRGETD